MARSRQETGNGPFPKQLRLPDLDEAKSVVLNSLSAIDAQREYRYAIEIGAGLSANGMADLPTLMAR